MSTYGVNKVGWLVVHDAAFRSAVLEDPVAALGPLDLTADERQLLLAGDVRALLGRGAHAYLLANLMRVGAFGLDRAVYVRRMRDGEPVAGKEQS